MKIEDIDKNFRAATVGDTEIKYSDVTTNDAISLEGFVWRKESDAGFSRLPHGLSKEEINEGALYLACNTAGGAARFRTDSTQIFIRAELSNSADMNHMPRTGSAGFDIYRGRGKKMIHYGSAQPGRDQKILELLIASHTGEMEDFTINFPLYGGIDKLEIGVLPTARLEEATPHKIKKPILFYGSSITQGGCASRPGNAYTSMLCRAVDAPQINLGFSGCGRGEAKMAELISELDLAAFVMDYDHNAPDPEHLEATHEKFFKIVRDANKELPIVIMSKCDIWPEIRNAALDINLRRREIIRKTYENALASGDANVYFVDGETLFGKKRRGECTVDRCHPNDLGFYRMFKNVLPTLKMALNPEKNIKSSVSPEK